MFCFEHDFREWKYRSTASYIGLHFNHENCNCIELQLIVFSEKILKYFKLFQGLQQAKSIYLYQSSFIRNILVRKIII